MAFTSLILEFLRAGRFESAWELMQDNGIAREGLDYCPVLESLERKIRNESTAEDVRNVLRLKRRLEALKGFRTFGLDPQKLIVSVTLREGYQGKVLLVRIAGGRADGLVCLRSGDDWHREILRNTKEEIQDLGFEHANVVPVGGAWIRFDPKGSILLFGGSDEFGTCDKTMAAHLIERAFPGRKITIRSYIGT